MYRRILVPLDGSETAEKVLPWVEAECLCHGAEATLLRVIPPMRSTFMMPPRFLEQFNQQANEMASEYLAGVAARLQAEGLKVKTEIRLGPPAETILDLAEQTACDLIIIGSHGETGAARWRFGGVAFKVVKSTTNMPVLIVST